MRQRGLFSEGILHRHLADQALRFGDVGLLSMAVAMASQGPLGVALMFPLPAMVQELVVDVASANRYNSQQD
jgi:hypothetical protein